MKRLILILIVFAGWSTGIFGANYYWVGGTGSWPDYAHHWATSSGGSLFHMQVPGANDTVIFDTLSFTAPNDTVYADSSVLYCYTMKWENVQFHPVFANQVFATNTILKIYGSLQLDTGLSWMFTGLVRFYGLNPGNTIRSAGQFLPSMQFDGDTTGTWTLEDTLHAGEMIFTTGIFRTAGLPVFCGSMTVETVNHSAVLLDTSYLQLGSLNVSSSAWQFDADSATIRYLGSSIDGGGTVFHKVIFENAVNLVSNDSYGEAIFNTGCYISSDNTFGKLLLPHDGCGIIIHSGVIVTVTDTLAISGSCHSVNALFSDSPGNAYISMPAGIVSVDHLVIDGVSASGAATFNASNCFLSGAISGWTIVSQIVPRNLFWVGGSGDWNDPSHWSLSSGGTGGECPPTPADSLYFDAASFPAGNDTAWAHLPMLFFHQLAWTNNAGNAFFHSNSTIQAYGSYRLSPQMQEYAGPMFFRDTTQNTVIDPAGNSLGSLVFVGPGNRTVPSALQSLGSILISRGTLHTNGFAVTAWDLSIGAAQVDFAGSVVNAGRYSSMSPLLSPPSLVTASSFTDNAGDHYPKLIVTGNGTLSGSSSFFDYVKFDSNAVISGNNSFDTLLLSHAGADISFGAFSTQIIHDTLAVNSSCTEMTFMHSSSEGTPASLVMPFGSVVLDDLILEDLDATGNFTALNSVAIANVNGWTVTPPPSTAMYWIGGTGDWNDPSHWSAVSGGTPGTCAPNPLTDVFFDANSFTGNNDLVRINIPHAYCRNMIWNGTTGQPSMIDVSNGNLLRCYGSFVLDSNVTASQSTIHFRSVTQGNTINANDQEIGNIVLKGVGGAWTLNGDLRAGTLSVETGRFKTAGFTIDAGSISVSDSLLLDSSAVYAQRWSAGAVNGTYLDADSSHIAISGNSFNGGNGQRYHEIIFTGDVTAGGNDTIGFARFTRMTTITGNTVFDSVFFDNPGQQIIFAGGSTQQILGKILSSATAALPIGIESDHGYLPSGLVKTADTVCLDFLNLRGIAASGGAVFYAGANSSDAGGNSGWTWTSCQPAMVNVWPGDANRDLTADNLDLLAIGVAFGRSGPARANASLSWVAQPAYTWNTLFANTSDIANADCDGDGVIGYSDTTAVLLNYGLTHPARLQAPDSVQSTGTKLWLSTPLLPVMNGDTASIGIMLGTAQDPANNVYGIAFQLNYNDTNIVPGSVWIECNGSWMCPTGNEVHLVKHFPGQMIMMVALSRIDHANASGSGEIARIHFRVTPGFFGWFKGWFSDIHLIDSEENPLPVTSQLGTFMILGMNEISLASFHGYPNPTHGVYTIDDERVTASKTQITVTDMTGRTLMEMKTTTPGTLQIDLGTLPAGTYLIRVDTEMQSFIQRVIRE